MAMSEMSMASEVEPEKVREMLTATQVRESVPFDRRVLARLENAGLFPQGHYVTPRKKLYFADDIARWQRDLANPRSKLSKSVRLKLSKPSDGE